MSIPIARVVDCTVEPQNPNLLRSKAARGRLVLRALSTKMKVVVEWARSHRSDAYEFCLDVEGGVFKGEHFSSIRKENDAKWVDYEVLLLGRWDEQAAGLVLESVNNGKYKRIGLWTCNLRGIKGSGELIFPSINRKSSGLSLSTAHLKEPFALGEKEFTIE
jgi:hypothetical protein